MATTEAQPGDLAVLVEDVADSASAACWAVEEQGWKDLVPEMSDEVIELLAPAVVVTAATLPTERQDHALPARLVLPTVPRRLRRSR